MRPANEGMLRDYALALEEYLETPGEDALEHAYEVGRRAIAGGLGVVDVATAHQKTLVSVLSRSSDPLSVARAATRASEFLVESLSPFEMTLRGFAEANRHLEAEIAERKRAEAALREAHDNLEARVQKRTAEIRRANDLLRAEARERERAEAALRQSEEGLRSLVESVRDYAIIRLDPEGRVASWNAGAQRIKGYQPEEIIGRDFACFYVPEEAQEGEPKRALATAAAEGRYEQEGLRVRKDGSRFYADVVIAAVRDEAGRLMGFSKITRDITERKQAETALQRLNDELHEAIAAKDQFLATLSHELRNPLAAIIAGTELLRHALPPEPRLQRTVEIIERNAHLQARLVNDLLDLSRITRGKMQLQRAPLALDSLVHSAVLGNEAEAAQAGLSIHLQAVPDLWVLGDYDRLHQVLLNLLSNAIKFTPPTGRILVRVERVQGSGMARIVVEDTGIGLDRALLDHLFDMFQQGEVAGQQRSGLGIGLALVRLITDKHGGRVWAESDGPAKGSRFTVELPLIAGPERSAARAWPGQRSGPVDLLLVEDNADTRTLLADNLRMMGYAVRAAGTAEDALELLAREGAASLPVGSWQPDIILADIGLPGMTGYEFLRRVRRLPGLADVPAFAVTGLGQEEDVRQAHEAGFAGHFVKPVDIGALDSRIREWLMATE